MTPQEMYDLCFEHECKRFEHMLETRGKGRQMLKLYGYAETTIPLTLHKWNGSHPPDDNMTPVELPVGTTVKALMFSRFGDFGITDDLKAENGYHMRLFPTVESQGDSSLAEIREGWLTAAKCLTNFRTEDK